MVPVFAMDGEEELAIIQRAAQGDHEAFRQIVLAYERPLLAYLNNMLSDRDNAYDIAQESFITLFHTLPRWEPPNREGAQTSQTTGLLSPWLYRIATNRALSLLRKQQVRQRHHVSGSSEWSEEQTYMHTMTSYTTQESFEERHAARDLLQEALRHLSEIDAMCLILHYIEGEKYRDIAERLGTSSEAVRKRITRAMKVLRSTYHTLNSEVRS